MGREVEWGGEGSQGRGREEGRRREKEGEGEEEERGGKGLDAGLVPALETQGLCSLLEQKVRVVFDITSHNESQLHFLTEGH